jgi:hypothetical protein
MVCLLILTYSANKGGHKIKTIIGKNMQYRLDTEYRITMQKIKNSN